MNQSDEFAKVAETKQSNGRTLMMMREWRWRARACNSIGGGAAGLIEIELEETEIYGKGE
jgi:hypothetical protein